MYFWFDLHEQNEQTNNRFCKTRMLYLYFLKTKKQKPNILEMPIFKSLIL